MTNRGRIDYYTVAQVRSEALPECMIAWRGKRKIVKNLTDTFYRWRGKHERQTHI